MHETDRAAHGWTKTKRLNPPMDRWQGHMDLHCEEMADVFPAQDRTWELEVQTPTSCQTQWTQCRSYHGQINCNNMHHHFQYTTAMVSFFFFFFFFFFCCCCYYQLLGKELNSLISNCYRSHSSCFSCWATSSKKPKAPSFQNGWGWNLAGIFFMKICIGGQSETKPYCTQPWNYFQNIPTYVITVLEHYRWTVRWMDGWLKVWLSPHYASHSKNRMQVTLSNNVKEIKPIFIIFSKKEQSFHIYLITLPPLQA